MEERCLFLFGECIEEPFCTYLPLSADMLTPYTLTDYTAVRSPGGRAYLAPQKGETVSGFLCPADDALLWKMDQWKGVPALRRVALPVEFNTSGAVLESYIANDVSHLTKTAKPLEDALEEFTRLLAESELGKCDVHLMFPCSFETARLEQISENGMDVITSHFIAQLQQANHDEFADSYLELERRCMGVYAFSIGPMADAQDMQTGFLYFSRHKATQVGSVNVVFPNTTVSALRILNSFCGNLLTVQTGTALQPFIDWLSAQYGIAAYGTPRAVLFAHNPITREQVIKCLAMESEPMGKLVGPTLCSYAEDNFAQYNVAEVYASPKCLVEIESACCPQLQERLGLESVEIFFVELLLLQTASIRRICKKIVDYMNSDEVLAGEKNYGKLIALSSEMSSAVLFFDYDHFLYPTVSIACEKISKRFGMEAELQKYYEYRAILEQMINLAQEQREKIENDNMNLLLLILTLVQVLPTLIETFQMWLEGSWSSSILVSWGLSIAACAVLCGLFSLYKRHQVRRANKNHKRRS